MPDAPLAEALTPFVSKPSKYGGVPALPPPNMVDWTALSANILALRQVIDILSQQMESLRLREDEDDLEALTVLLLVA